jgi:hypothetical protein
MLGATTRISFFSTSSSCFRFPAAPGFTCDTVPKGDYVVTLQPEENLIKFPLVIASHTGSDWYWVYRGKFIENKYQTGSAKLVITPTSQKNLMLSYLCSEKIRHDVPFAAQEDVLRCVSLMNRKK